MSSNPTRTPIQVGPSSILLWLCLACTFAIVSWTLFHEYRSIFHSDGAIKSVLAQLAWQEHRFVPRQWVYANGDLLFVGPQLFSILLHPLTGISYFSNALSDWIAYLCLVLAAYGTCLKLAPARPAAAVAAACLTAGGLSSAHFEFVIGQGTYAIYAALSLVLFTLVSGEPSPSPAKRRLSLLFAALVAAIACSANPLRAIVTIVLPLIAGWIASCVFKPAPTFRSRFLRAHNPVVYAVFAGAVVGTAIYYKLLLPHLFNFDAAARLNIASPATILEHIRRLPAAWFDYFLIAGPWAGLSPALRAVQYLAWAVALLAILGPLWVLLTPRRHDRMLHAFAWIVFTGYCASFASLALSAELFTGAIEIRYATFSICGSLCVMAVLFAGIGERHPARSRVELLGLCVAALAVSLVWRTTHSVDYRDRGVNFGSRTVLIDYLRKAGVGATLSSYWHSHVLTVLSGGEIIGYPVGLGTQLSAFPHHMPRSLITSGGGHRQAVVLAREESNAGAWNAVEYQLGAPLEKRDLGAFVVWVYDRDIVTPVLGLGHEMDQALPKDRVRARLSQTAFPPCPAQAACEAFTEVSNTGVTTLATAGSRPLRLGLQALDTEGGVLVHDLGRADFPYPIEPGKSARVRLLLPTVADARFAGYRLCLLQEAVGWLCDRTQGPPLTGEIDVAQDTTALAIALDASELPACRSTSAACVHRVQVRNDGRASLSSRGTLPLRIGVQGLGRDGQIVQWDLGRADFSHPLKQGEASSVEVSIPPALDPGITSVRLCLLQEGVAWHCDKTHEMEEPLQARPSASRGGGD